jgi:AcrR family transcriptional regulator
MPKVTEEYIANKKKMITDATYALCLEKTVSTVTMQDIINRTGLSQGGIYRFYHDIDEIFADMLVQMRQRFTLKEQLDEIQ